MHKKLKLIAQRISERFHYQYLIAVVEQTHRGYGTDGFGLASSDRFLASNGFTLASISHPSFNRESKTLFVRGDNTSKDKECAIVSWQELILIREAVREYNHTFNDSPKATDVITVEEIE